MTIYQSITPHNYQQEAFDECCKNIRHYEAPFFVEASVGAGKTILMGMLCHRAQSNGMSVLVLARRGELVEQNSETFREMGVKNSIFSASLGIRSTHFPVVVGTEGTVARAIDSELKELKPDILIIDECITGETLISTTEGKIPINKLTKENKVFCLNEINGLIVADNPVRVFSNGMKNVSLIKLSNGENLTCTGSHKLYKNGLWIQAENLKVGQKIALSNFQKPFITKLKSALAAVMKELFQQM